MRILCDVDLCLVRTDLAWIDWLTEQTGVNKFIPNSDVEYDLSSYWKEELEAFDIDGFEFWRGPFLYNGLSPIPEAVECIEAMANVGHQIVFVSAIKGHHNKSKYYWLKHWFPYMIGYVATKEKFLVSGDIMIDDRHDNLNRMPEDVKVYCPITPYKQYEEPDNRITHFNWKAAKEIFEEKELLV